MLTQLILILQVGIITYLFAYTPANLMDYSGNTKDKKTRKSSIIGFTSHSPLGGTVRYPYGIGGLSFIPKNVSPLILYCRVVE